MLHTFNVEPAAIHSESTPASSLLLHRHLVCPVLVRLPQLSHSHPSNLLQSRSVRLQTQILAGVSTSNLSSLLPALLKGLLAARFSSFSLFGGAMDVMYEDRADAAERLAQLPEIQKYKNDPKSAR